MSAAHHDPDALAAATIDAARRTGCRCTPDVRLTEEYPGLFRATIEHDRWCPLPQRQLARLD